MADTNEEHTQIDEDEPQIDEDQVWIENKRMREFERRNGVSVNECCGRRDGFLIHDGVNLPSLEWLQTHLSDKLGAKADFLEDLHKVLRKHGDNVVDGPALILDEISTANI
ncbi:hypothetical protein JHK82_048162 [Glycine max]|nr:hypothetical protein JHK82_048162 [Glycine max]